MGFQNLNSWTECIFVLNTMKIAVYAKSVRDPKHQVGFGELLMALSQRGHEIWLPPSLEDHVHMNIDSSMLWTISKREIIPLKRDRCYIWNHLIRYLIIHLPSMIL